MTIPLSLLLLSYDWKFASGHILGYSFGKFCDPDWDVITANNSESRMIKEIPVLGHFLFGISSWYGSYFFHSHRGFWSHFPVVSTAIRLIFVGIFPLLIADNLGINLIGNGWHMFWIGFWLGLSEADGIHSFLDATDERMKWATRGLKVSKLQLVWGWVISIIYLIYKKTFGRRK